MASASLCFGTVAADFPETVSTTSCITSQPLHTRAVCYAKRYFDCNFVFKLCFSRVLVLRRFIFFAHFSLQPNTCTNSNSHKSKFEL